MDPRRAAVASVASSTFRVLWSKFVAKIVQNAETPRSMQIPSVRHGWRISEVRCQKFQMESGDLKLFFFQKKRVKTKS